MKNQKRQRNPHQQPGGGSVKSVKMSADRIKSILNFSN